MTYSEKFWTDIVKEKEDHVVIDGLCYYISPYDEGFGGYQHKIRKFGSDEIIVTKNLWYNGKVPEKFRSYLPDNAEFVR